MNAWNFTHLICVAFASQDLHGRNPSSEYSTNKALQKTWRSHLLHPSGTVDHQEKKQSPPLHVIRILNRQTIIRTIMTANVREYTIVLICTSTLFVWCLSICLQYASCHREHLATTSTTAQWKLTISSLSSKVSLILWSLHSICLSRASTNESLRMLAFSWTPWGRQQARRVPREIFFSTLLHSPKTQKTQAHTLKICALNQWQVLSLTFSMFSTCLLLDAEWYDRRDQKSKVDVHLEIAGNRVNVQSYMMSRSE